MNTESEEGFIPYTEVDKVLRERILHVLGIWTRLSPSMLQVGIGPAMPPKIWHPVLNRLIEEGIVLREKQVARTPSGRDLEHTILMLSTQSQPAS